MTVSLIWDLNETLSNIFLILVQTFILSKNI